MKFDVDVYILKLRYHYHKYSIKISFICAFFTVLLIELFNYTHPKYLDFFYFKENNSLELLDKSFETYSGLFGLSIAILSIILSVIQISKKRIALLEFLVNQSKINFIFSFGIINLIIISITYLFIKSDYSFNANTFQILIYSSYISLILYILLLLYSFYKVFQIVSDKSLLSEYLNYLELFIKFEQKIQNDTEVSQQLYFKLNELDGELLNSIKHNNIENIQIILNFFSNVISNYPNSKILKSFDTKLIKWTLESFKSDSFELKSQMVNFWTKSLENNNFNIKFFPSKLYLKASELKNKNIRKQIVEIYPERLKSYFTKIIWEYGLNQKNITQLEESYSKIQDLTELIHVVLKDGNVSLLKIILNELSLIQESIYYSNESKNKQLVEFKKPINDILNNIILSKFLNLSWEYFNCITGKVSTQEMLQKIKILEDSFKINNSEFISFSVKTINVFHNQIVENWIWDSEERMNGQAYSIDSENEIIATGILVWLVKSNINDFEFNQDDLNCFPKNEVENFLSLIKSKLNIFKNRHDFWLEIIGKDYLSKIENIDNLINSLNQHSTNKRNTEIISEELSLAKIDDFKNQIMQQWKKYNTLEKVFEYFNVDSKIVDETSFSKEGLTPFKILFKKGKILFIEKNYQPVFGIESGVNLCISQNLHFKNTLLKEIPTDKKHSLLEALFEIIELNKCGSSINIIFVPINYWYLNEMDIINSGYFKNANQVSGNYEFDLLGLFNDTILIVPLTYYDNDSIVIAMNINESIEIERVTNTEWIDNKVLLEIEEINQSKVQEFKKSNPEANESEVIEFKTSVYVKLGLYFKISILNKENIKLFKLD